MTKSIRNEEDWQMIYDLPIFNDDTQSELKERAWKWIEKLRDEGKLRSIDLLRLHALLTTCCEYDPKKD